MNTASWAAAALEMASANADKEENPASANADKGKKRRRRTPTRERPAWADADDVSALADPAERGEPSSPEADMAACRDGRLLLTLAGHAAGTNR